MRDIFFDPNKYFLQCYVILSIKKQRENTPILTKLNESEHFVSPSASRARNGR